MVQGLMLRVRCGQLMNQRVEAKLVLGLLLSELSLVRPDQQTA